MSMTLYVPPDHLEAAVKTFGTMFRDKANSHYGYSRIECIDYAGLEDGSICCTFLDKEKPDHAMWIKWTLDTQVDGELRKLINGEVKDHTEAYDAVEEHIKPEDR